MASIKFSACQARSVNHYKNLGTKVMNCCANIYFIRQCLVKEVVPKYASIKVTYTSPASYLTQKKIQTARIKDEIKFLCKKKTTLIIIN